MWMMLIVGAAAGYLASRLMGLRTDPATAVLLGMLGAIVGSMGLRLVQSAVHGLLVLVAAIAGAMLVIWLWQVFVERR